jgi:hypothetical protein
MVGGLRSVALVLGLIPLVGAALMWAVPDALGLTDTSADWPTARWLTFSLLALTAVGAASWAHRRGASWWAALWGLAAGTVAAALFFAMLLVLLAVAPGETGGCPQGKIYC